MLALQNLSTPQIYLYLSALKAIATIDFQQPMSDSENRCLEAISKSIFLMEDYESQLLTNIKAQQIKTVFPKHEIRQNLLQMQCVMALINAVLNEDKIKVVLDYAQELNITDPYIVHMQMLHDGNIGLLLEDMTIKNYQSIFNETRSYKEIQHIFFPYTGTDEDKRLAEKFHSLEQLEKESLGYQFWQWYTSRGFKFPGEPEGFCEAFAVPHDSTHIIAGYDTNAEGEINVSTFTAHMHKKLPMTGHILPVILTWHLGIDVNELVRTNIGKLNIEKFWIAWRRGYQINTNIFSPSWNFWDLKNRHVHELQKEYGL